ncbi:N-lysine methyltransferase SMYD2 [Trametes pubescens]|uniref:N-lysine methyltransferase SMYD2 n=1 Tax=Trametes pubescens TaxID=154538 RepID=A0A1M2V2C4_TRAPU|nr:N-lysine methyltransferase SMYD2 [Trametes pubescens]
MSFGKLKSARKAKEFHSYVKPDGSSLSDAEGLTASLNTAPASDSTEQIEQLAGSGANTEPDQMQHTSAHPAQTPRTDEVPYGSLAEESQEVQPDLKPAPSTVPGKAPDGPVQRNAETTTPVPLNDCHISLPASLQIRESSRHGRGIYTNTALQAGTVVMSIVPHVSVLSTSYLDQHCSACAASATESGLKRCPKCKTVYYCDKACQDRDWAWHKHECSALQTWAASAPSPDVMIPSDAVRCLGRILWGSQKEGPDSTWAREIRMMQSNRASVHSSSVEDHTYLAHSLVRYLGVRAPADLQPFSLSSASDLVDLISRFTTNTFTLTSASLSPIGICVAPTVAFANHSCSPNAVIVFPRAQGTPASKEPSLNLVALRDIAPGKEVRISYVDTTLPKDLRQKELTEVYNFTCQCKLCTKPPTVDPRESLWCPKKCGGTCPLPTEEDNLFRCTKCGAGVTNVDAVLDAARIGQEALDKATSLQFRGELSLRSKGYNATQLTTNIIPILVSTGLTPSAHPLLAMTRLHQELLIASLPTSLSQESLDEVIRTAAKYNAGLQPILPKGHPIRAIALAELGKLLAVDEPASLASPAQASMFPPSGPPRLKLAYESLVRAHEELLVGFGKANGGGHVGRDVRDAIARLEKEIGVWTSGIKNALEDSVLAQRAG